MKTYFLGLTGIYDDVAVLCDVENDKIVKTYEIEKIHLAEKVLSGELNVQYISAVDKTAVISFNSIDISVDDNEVSESESYNTLEYDGVKYIDKPDILWCNGWYIPAYPDNLPKTVKVRYLWLDTEFISPGRYKVLAYNPKTHDIEVFKTPCILPDINDKSDLDGDSKTDRFTNVGLIEFRTRDLVAALKLSQNMCSPVFIDDELQKLLVLNYKNKVLRSGGYIPINKIYKIESPALKLYNPDQAKITPWDNIDNFHSLVLKAKFIGETSASLDDMELNLLDIPDERAAYINYQLKAYLTDGSDTKPYIIKHKKNSNNDNIDIKVAISDEDKNRFKIIDDYENLELADFGSKISNRKFQVLYNLMSKLSKRDKVTSKKVLEALRGVQAYTEDNRGMIQYSLGITLVILKYDNRVVAISKDRKMINLCNSMINKSNVVDRPLKDILTIGDVISNGYCVVAGLKLDRQVSYLLSQWFKTHYFMIGTIKVDYNRYLVYRVNDKLDEIVVTSYCDNIVDDSVSRMRLLSNDLQMDQEVYKIIHPDDLTDEEINLFIRKYDEDFDSSGNLDYGVGIW